MKNILLFCALIFGGLLTYAQEECKDIIYTAEGNNIIFDCCIKEVKSGNIVYYTKEGDTLQIAASGITKDGQFIDLIKFPKPKENQKLPAKENHSLYRGHDLKYYQDTYKIAHNQMGTGVILTSVGVLCELAGIIILYDKQFPESRWQTTGTVLIFSGPVFATIGIPLWISGEIKRANNQSAIDEIQRSSELSFGFTQDGIGLILNF